MISERVQELLVRARNAFRLRDYETADLLVDQMLEEYPESIAGHILKGIILGRTRRNKEAIRTFRRALELDPVNAEAFNNIAVSLRQEGKLHEALRAVQKAEELFGERADILYNKGNILKDLGQIEEAIGSYLQAIEVDSRYVLAYNNLGTLYQARGDLNQAIETFSIGLSVDPNHPTLRYNLGLAYEEGGKLKEAEHEYERSLKSRPGWAEALNNLGIVFQKQDRYQEADRTFREILRINRRDPRASNNLATNYALQGRTREAMQFYREALEADPSYSRAAGNLGQLIDTGKDVTSAVDELQQLADLDTENIELQFRLAVALSRTDKYVDAERVLLRILARDAKHVEATRLLADIYLRSGEDEKADAAYKRLLTISADYVEHHYDRARVYQLRGEVPTALREIETYLESKPGDLDGLMLKASILVDAKRQDEAISMLEELRNIYPGDGRVMAAIATAHQRGGEREEAIRAFDELINLQGSRASAEDIEALSESLALYEQAVDDLAGELNEDWERNINRLVELSQPEGQEEEEGELAVDEQVSLDEDSIPILSFGGEELLEPDEWEVQVEDDDETDEEEYLGVEPAQSLAPSLTSLPEQSQLRGGESFAEGLRPQYGTGPIAPPPAPEAPAFAEDQAPYPQAPPPQPPQPQPAPRPQPPPPPRQPQAAQPAPQQAPAQPAQTQPPPSQPEPSQPPAYPEYQYPEPAYQEPYPVAAEDEPSDDDQAAADELADLLDEEEEQEAEALESEEDDLADVPEDFELVEDETVSPEEEPEVELGETPDSEIESDLAGYDDDVPTIDDLLGGVEDALAPEESDDIDEIGEPDESDETDEPDELVHAGDDVAVSPDLPEPVTIEPPRRPPPPPPPPRPKPAASNGPAGLLDYLSGMADALPAQKKQEYMESEVRLKLEYLRARLRGRPGLHVDGARYAKPEPAPVQITPVRLEETLNYIGQMSNFHPDQGIGAALRRRVGSVLEHIRAMEKN